MRPPQAETPLGRVARLEDVIVAIASGNPNAWWNWCGANGVEWWGLSSEEIMIAMARRALGRTDLVDRYQDPPTA